MLSVGGATAQQQQEAVCPDPPGNPAAGARVSCREEADSEKDISIDLDGFDIDTGGARHHGASGVQFGTGGVDIVVRGGVFGTTGGDAHGINGVHSRTDGQNRIIEGEEPGDVLIDVRNARIATDGHGAFGIRGLHRAGGDLDIVVRGGSVETTGERGRGIWGWHYNATLTSRGRPPHRCPGP